MNIYRFSEIIKQKIIVILLISCIPFSVSASQRQPDLSTLSKEAQSQLNKNYRTAIELFYQEQYSTSFLLFKKLKKSYLNYEIQYGLAKSALKLGHTKEAINNFKQILEKKPELYQVRLELTESFLAAGQYENARKEISKLKSAPDIFQKDLNILKKRLKLLDQRLIFNLRSSIGFKQNDNLNASPDQDAISLPEGGEISGLSKKNGTASINKTNIDFSWDFAEKGGYSWNNQFNFFVDDYCQNDFDFSIIDFRTTLENKIKTSQNRFSLGYKEKKSAHRSLSHLLYFSPQQQYFITDNLDLFVTYKLSSETFADQSLNNQQNNITHSISINPLIRLNTNAFQMISFNSNYSDKDADSDIETGYDRFSYHEWEIAPYYFIVLENGIEIFSQLKHKSRKYGGKSFGYSSKRHDKQYGTTLIINYNFLQSTFVSANISYTNNDSNFAFYKYDQFIIGLEFGFNLEI
jgi:hypothetical protein